MSQLSNPFTAWSTQKPDCSVTCCHASSAWATTACSWWRLQNMRITDASVTMWPSCRQLEESKTDSSRKKAHKKEGFPPWLWDSLLAWGIHFYLLQSGFVNLWNLVEVSSSYCQFPEVSSTPQVMEGNFCEIWMAFPLPEGETGCYWLMEDTTVGMVLETGKIMDEKNNINWWVFPGFFFSH